MSTKFRDVIFAVLAVALLTCPVILFGFVLLLAYSCDWFPYAELSKIDVGNGRTVSIYSKSCWEVSRPLYYDAREADKVIIPYTRWDNDTGSEEYTLAFISAEDGTLVGVYDPDQSLDEFFILIDFKSGASWSQSAPGAKARFHQRLLREHPGFIRQLKKTAP
jgi:hypothetical protein